MAAVRPVGRVQGITELREGLHRAGFPDGADPYTVLVADAPGPHLADAVARAGVSASRTLVVLRSADPDRRLVWQLLDLGAADVLAWSDGRTAGQVADRLRRWRVIDDAVAGPEVAGRLVGRSPALRAALEDLVELAMFGTGPILLVGETGTGKELAARVVHDLDATRRARSLVVVDCTTIVPTLSGSELFGHERGAFTGADRARAGAFAAADAGTLFLDEVGELPVGLQAELLRVVQEHTYKPVGGDTWATTDFRLVSATNRDLAKEQRKGRFRSDLYHRIASGVVRLPPLRERPEDLETLFGHFLGEALERPAPELSPDVVAMLHARTFPGNLRELRQLAFRVAARHAGDGPVTPGDLPRGERPTASQRDTLAGALETAVRHSLHTGVRLQDLKTRVSDLAVELALAEAGGNAHEAAVRLGVTDRAVQKRRQVARADE